MVEYREEILQILDFAEQLLLRGFDFMYVSKHSSCQSLSFMLARVENGNSQSCTTPDCM